jgi:hypothetical protein
VLSLRNLAPLFTLLVLGEFAAAQTVVNSTFLDHYPIGNYSDPNNWTPAEVPNNTAAKQFNVTIAVPFFVDVDIDGATISNLTLGGGQFSGLTITNRTFSVTGTTVNQSESGAILIESGRDAPAKFSAGTLTNFSANTLRGNYRVASYGTAATLQFIGANIFTLRDGDVELYGSLAAIMDESGNDALRTLGRLDSTATLWLSDHNLVTQAPFFNDGSIFIYPGYMPTAFTATVSLENFDPATRTITGGTFSVSGAGSAGGLAELRFNGADIVNVASVIQLITPLARIADLAGNDGLRNLARILPAGSLNLDRHDFSTVGSFTNEGSLALNESTFTITGSFNDFDLATGTISGGIYSLTGGAVLKFSGADIVHNSASVGIELGSRITDMAGTDALRNFRDNLADGSFTVDQGYLFTAPGDFTNAGRIDTIRAVSGIHQPIWVSGEFRVPSGSAYTQTAGATVNDGTFTAEKINIMGGSFSGGGSIKGNVTVSNAIITPGGKIEGNLTLRPDARLHSQNTPFGVDVWSQITGTASLAGTLEIELTGPVFPSSTDVISIVQSTGPLTGLFSNAPNGARITTTDGSGSFVVLYDSNSISLTQYQAEPPPAQLLNISTRAFLSRADDDSFGDRAVLIGGFIISGVTEPKEVVLRGIGPSLARSGLSPVLADPVLELHAGDGSLLATNDNWKDTQSGEIAASGLAPGDQREAALRITLQPGAYTVVLKEKSGLAGYGLVEIYDLSKNSGSKLANISTRGFVDASDVLIGGIIAGGDGQANAEIVVRAIGPQLQQNGISNALDDPTLELRDSNGNLISFNDDWSTNYDQVVFSRLAPFNNTESAMLLSLPRGNYTAIVRAKGNSGGVALVEFYDLRR